jgi:hypothetical protein
MAMYVAEPAHVVRPAESRDTPADRRSLLLAVLLGFAAFGVVLAGTRSTLFDLDRHAVPKELVLHLAALLSLLFLLPRWRAIRPGMVEFLLALFIGWSALSAVFATNHWIALRAFGLSFSAFIVFIAARQLAPTSWAARVLAVLAIAGTVAAAIGVAQAYGVEMPWLATERAPGGTFGNRNFLAHFVTLAMPVVIVSILSARRRFSTIAWPVCLAICVNVIVLTRSRAAWLGFAAAIVILASALALSRRTLPAITPMPRLRIAAVAILVGWLTAVILPNRLEWRSESPYAQTLTRLTDYRSGSGRGRLIQYRNSLDLIAIDPILGTGPGNWFIKYPLVTSRGDPSFNSADPIPTNPWPSSDWIALVAERGIIGLITLLVAGAAIITISVRRLVGGDPGSALNAAASLGILAASTVTGVFDAVLLNPAPAGFVAISLGLLLPRTRAVVDRPLEGRARRIAIFGVTILAAAISVYSLVQLLAIRVTRESQTRATIERAARIDPTSHRLRLQLARRGACVARIPHARAAASLMPYHEAPRRALAACGVRNKP